MKKRALGIWLISLLAVSMFAGCVWSEQSGRPFGNAIDHAEGRNIGDISFHFRSTINYVVLALRLGLLVGLAWLVRYFWSAGVKKNAAVAAVLAVLTGAAGWFFVTGAARVVSYRITATESRLSISIPFHTHADLAWSDIIAVDAKGQKVTATYNNVRGPSYKKWKTLEITTARGKTYELDLTDLGVVQRSNLIAAIMERSNLHRLSPQP